MEHHTGIPLTVVSGFLGSGKTTLINRILATQSGLRIAVLVNDFGSINVDAHLIASAGGEAIALTNGCICCSIGDDFTDTLIRVVETSPKPDWIVIEASGVSDPKRIAQVGLADPALLLDGVIVLADAESIQSNASEPRLHDSILRQLKAADVLILNKIDLVSDSQKEAVTDWLSRLNPKAWIYKTVNSEVPLAALTGLAISKNSASSQATLDESSLEIEDAHSSHEHTHLFSTWTFETDQILSQQRLRHLLNNMPAGIIRAKGIVRVDTAPNQETVFQFAGQSRLLRSSGQQWQNGTSQIVFISPYTNETFTELKSETENIITGVHINGGESK
jgi:G3E family GTPase